MTAQELLTKVKALVFSEDMPESVVGEVPKYSLKDGSTVSITELAPGGVVTLESGEPAPAGDHVLADGIVITVGEGGVISGVQVPTEVMPQVEVEDEMKKKFSAFESELADIKASNIKLAEGFVKHQQIIEQMFALVQTLAKEPSTEPTEKPEGFKAASAKTKTDKVLSFSNHISSIIKNK